MSDSWEDAALEYAQQEWVQSRDMVFDFVRARHAFPPTRDEYRAWAKGNRALSKALKRKVSEPEQKVSREEILEAEVRELRSALAKDRRQSVAAARVENAIQVALSKVQPPRLKVLKSTPQVRDAHHRALLQLSDFHGGENVNPETINGLNDYSWDIMQERVEQMLQAVLSHKKNSPKLTGLVVTFGGDMCSGANHMEIAVTNEYPLAEQGVKMGYIQADIVKRLAPHFDEVEVLQVEGNHPRLVQKPAAKEPHNNMDWVAGILAKEALRSYQNVKYTVGQGSVFFKVAGRTVLLTHGDGIRSSMIGVPWGGLMRRANTIQARHKERIDHFLFHHFHQACVVDGARILLNGALKGTDEWVEKNFGGGQDPTQLLHLFDEKAGRYVSTQYITPTAGLP